MKLSDLSPEDWFLRLNTKRLLQARASQQWWNYLDLKQPLTYVARILQEQGDRFPPLLIAWPRLVTSSVTERMQMQAFLLADENPVEELNAAWRANREATTSAEAHTAASVAGTHFAMVGPDGPAGYPLVTNQYDDQVAVELDPRTGQPMAGIIVWREDAAIGSDVHAAVYVPTWPTVTGQRFGPCEVHEFVNGKLIASDYLGSWSETIANDPTLPSVPFVPYLTDPRKGRGQSGLVDLKPVVDGVNQTATNMLAAIEHHAVGRKWLIGAGQGDFVDEAGNEIPVWRAAMGDVWAIPRKQKTRAESAGKDIEVGQFPASDLRNFHESIKTLATIAASVYGLPPNYMGYSSDNPPSAESILYSVERLVLRTERHILWYGDAHEQKARIMWAIMGNDPKALVGMESKWSNPATPTIASRADAAVKLVQAGIIDDEQAWDDIGYSEQAKKRMRDRKAVDGSAFAAAAAGLRNLDVGSGGGVEPPIEPPALPVGSGAPAPAGR